MDEPGEIALFPLNTVLFPGGVLPLRIFEARYLDMISECLRDHKGFGVCAIRSGGEVGQAALCYPVGTLARVQDFDRGDDGLLQVVARGERRFRVVGQHVEPNQLLRAEVVWLEDGGSAALPQDRQPQADFLRQQLKRARRVKQSSMAGPRVLRLAASRRSRSLLLWQRRQRARLERRWERGTMIRFLRGLAPLELTWNAKG